MAGQGEGPAGEGQAMCTVFLHHHSCGPKWFSCQGCCAGSACPSPGGAAVPAVWQDPVQGCKMGRAKGALLQPLPWAVLSLQLHSSAIFLFVPPNPAVPLSACSHHQLRSRPSVPHWGEVGELSHFCCLPCTPFKACIMRVYVIACAVFEQAAPRSVRAEWGSGATLAVWGVNGL